jgi:hypothetical protein
VTDGDCYASSNSCESVHCLASTCETDAVADGVPAVDAESPPCQQIVCDGKGGTRTIAAPSNTPVDTPHDCQKDTCDSLGNVTSTPAPSDVPIEPVGDCLVASCDAAGNAVHTPGDNPPAASTCDTFSCQSGTAVGAPQNVGTVCDTTNGFACGATGECNVCPQPNASCTDPGPGASARTPATAFDFTSIGHCDSGGRSFCGALAAGESAWFTFYDDGTGPLCDFDPHIEFNATSAGATLCQYWQCPSLACPSGTTSATSAAGDPGCCIAGPAGSYAGFATSPCQGMRSYIEVQAGSEACTGYALDFND